MGYVIDPGDSGSIPESSQGDNSQPAGALHYNRLELSTRQRICVVALCKLGGTPAIHAWHCDELQVI